MMFLPDLVKRIYSHFDDLDCALEFRGCFAAFREKRTTKVDCCALQHVQSGLQKAGINVHIIPETSGAEAADLSLYGTATTETTNVDSIGRFLLEAEESKPVIPVVITGDGDFTRAILLLRSYSFPVLLVRPEHGMVNADFLGSTPHQIVWGSNHDLKKSWDKDVCVVAEAVKCLQASERGYRFPKMTGVITEKINEILGRLSLAGRYPSDDVAWREFVERSFPSLFFPDWFAGAGLFPVSLGGIY